MLNKSGIYEILNTANGKRYIGSTKCFRVRWAEHRWKLLRGAHHSIALQNAWNKYGEASFKFLPILTCAQSMLLFYEQQLLDKAKPEYNIALSAASPMRGRVTSESTRRKQSLAHIGLPRSEEHKRNNAAAHIGKPVSEATKERLRRLNLGRKASAETRAKQSASMLGKNSGPKTEAHKAALRAAKANASQGEKDARRTRALGNKNCLGKQNSLGTKRTPEQIEVIRENSRLMWVQRRANEGVSNGA